MTLDMLATTSTYIAFLVSFWGVFLIRRVDHSALVRSTKLLVLWHAFVYMGLFAFDTSYEYAALSIQDWAIWRRVFARINYGIMHLVWGVMLSYNAFYYTVRLHEKRSSLP